MIIDPADLRREDRFLDYPAPGYYLPEYAYRPYLHYADSDKGWKVDMCKSMQEDTLKTKVLSAIELYRTMIDDDAEVVKMVVKQLGVSPEYVKNLMTPVPT